MRCSSRPFVRVINVKLRNRSDTYARPRSSRVSRASASRAARAQRCAVAGRGGCAALAAWSDAASLPQRARRADCGAKAQAARGRRRLRRRKARRKKAPARASPLRRRARAARRARRGRAAPCAACSSPATRSWRSTCGCVARRARTPRAGLTRGGGRRAGKEARVEGESSAAGAQRAAARAGVAAQGQPRAVGARTRRRADCAARDAESRRAPPLAQQGPACALCRKQFTSAAQLEEHKLGKWHQMRLRGELPPARA
jgi:hypothetical protein